LSRKRRETLIQKSSSWTIEEKKFAAVPYLVDQKKKGSQSLFSPKVDQKKKETLPGNLQGFDQKKNGNPAPGSKSVDESDKEPFYRIYNG
jgi:hypothetical protein